jgi:hypothetical protein
METIEKTTKTINEKKEEKLVSYESKKYKIEIYNKNRLYFGLFKKNRRKWEGLLISPLYKMDNLVFLLATIHEDYENEELKKEYVKILDYIIKVKDKKRLCLIGYKEKLKPKEKIYFDVDDLDELKNVFNKVDFNFFEDETKKLTIIEKENLQIQVFENKLTPDMSYAYFYKVQISKEGWKVLHFLDFFNLLNIHEMKKAVEVIVEWCPHYTELKNIYPLLLQVEEMLKRGVKDGNKY